MAGTLSGRALEPSGPYPCLSASDGPTPPRDPRNPSPVLGPWLTCSSRAGSRCLGCGSGPSSSRAAHGRPLQAAPIHTLSPPRPAAKGNRGPKCNGEAAGNRCSRPESLAMPTVGPGLRRSPRPQPQLALPGSVGSYTSSAPHPLP